jgi:RsiW-degrading membrane proteinase PrsW (M82 family)
VQRIDAQAENGDQQHGDGDEEMARDHVAFLVLFAFILFLFFLFAFSLRSRYSSSPFTPDDLSRHCAAPS